MTYVRVTDFEAPKRRKEKTVEVRIDSIDVIAQRNSYTTLYIHGTFLHIQETAEQVHELIRLAKENA